MDGLVSRNGMISDGTLKFFRKKGLRSIGRSTAAVHEVDFLSWIAPSMHPVCALENSRTIHGAMLCILENLAF